MRFIVENCALLAALVAVKPSRNLPSCGSKCTDSMPEDLAAAAMT